MNFRKLVESAAVGYLLGTIPSSDIVSRVVTRGAVDLRAEGSGNPGGFNTMRVIGKKAGVAVIAADIAKGVAAGFAGRVVAGDGGGYVAATTAVAGHIWPVWSGFRGGKGFATAAGNCLGVFPAYFPADAALAGLGAAVLHDSERSMQVCAAAWTAASMLWWRKKLPNGWGPEPSFGLVASTALSSAMVVWKFRLARLAAADDA